MSKTIISLTPSKNPCRPEALAKRILKTRPILTSDNVACYLSGDLASWLKVKKKKHVRGIPLYL
tara:strand:+ start:35 stop:226 length:192 start_codon:yes stop_codon:yes gene_type:complete